MTRTTKWSPELEQGGEFRWRGICESLSQYAPPDILFDALRQLAQELCHLQGMLEAHGTPTSILTMPVLGYNYLPEKLKRWDLI